MLAELHIRNVAIIDDLRVRFSPGMTILSGETGAGKSIILDALGLVLGARANAELIREGADEAVVEAVFSLDGEPWVAQALTEIGLDPEPELVVRRVLGRSGRGRVHVNGSPVALSSLKVLAEGLVDYSSQHEHQVLLDPARHLQILDEFAGLEDQATQMRELYRRWQADQKALKELEQRALSRQDREEFLRFQLEELVRVDPSPGEDEELEVERKRLAHAEKLHAHARSSESLLYSGQDAVVESLGAVLKRLEEIVAIDPSVEPTLRQVESALYQVEDAARSLKDYARRVEFNPQRLEEIQSRLAELSALKRKHRGDLQAVIARRREMEQELATLTGFEERLTELQAASRASQERAWALARQLSERRHRLGHELARRVERELASLSMGRARFEVGFQTLRPSGDGAGLDEHGCDRVEFFLAANPGEPARPLSKVASGGELSRLLLALKHCLAGAGDVGTFIFDEVDTGVGGAVAEVMGQKLRAIAARRQVICITHLAQIAAYGHGHLQVSKQVQGGRTQTRVELLDGEARSEELARMLGGLHITERTREHAREMLERCSTYQPTVLEKPCQLD